MNVTTSRRRILARMGLAGAAPLVQGIAGGLVGRALGQTDRRRMALFLVHAESFVPAAGAGGYTPAGIDPLKFTGNGGTRRPADGQDEDRLDVAWPEFLAPLSAFRSRMAIVDGLDIGAVSNRDPLHGWQYGVLSCAGSSETPSGISIDQHVAGTLGREAPIRTLLFGAQVAGTGAVGTFASGPGAALSHALLPSTLFGRLTGAGPGTTAPTQGVASARLMDLLREDLRRLDRGLAGEEKARLAEYLSSMEAFKKKEDALAKQIQAGGCAFAAPRDSNAVANLGAMFRLATLALRCGVTNVIGVAIGNTRVHDDLEMLDPAYEGHGDYRGWLRKFAPTSMGWVATLLQELGPAAADITVTIVPANGVAHGGIHHGNRSFAAMVYDGRGALRTGARFFRRRRALADLYTTVAHAVGAPIERLNGAGTGKIDELLA